MSIRNKKDLRALQRVGRFVSDTLHVMKRKARAGMSAAELDAIAGAEFEKHGARSAPRVTYDFPGYTCISVGAEVAHGIPHANKILREGDLINIDVSAELDGYFADTGHSFQIAPHSAEVQRLIAACLAVQSEVIAHLRAGLRINQIGRLIQRGARTRGYGVIRNLASHGTGGALHEYPQDILNYYDSNDRRVLTGGLVLTIEPFLSTGQQYVVTDADGWTLRTPAGSFTAQHEHTMVVTDGAPLLLTYLN